MSASVRAQWRALQRTRFLRRAQTPRQRLARTSTATIGPTMMPGSRLPPGSGSSGSLMQVLVAQVVFVLRAGVG